MRAGGVIALALAGAGCAAAARASEPDPLAAHRWRARVLVVAAPAPDDPGLRAQRAALAGARAGADERDLVVLEAVGPGAQAQALRRRLDLPAGAFRAVLVGKDGGVKRASAEPIPVQTLFATIDAMPMRRDEVRARR